MHVDRAFFHVNVAAPDAIQELVTSVDTLRMSHEELEHAVLSGSQRHGPVGDHDAMAGLVESQTFELDHLVSAVARSSAQNGMDASEELTRRERLGDVVIRPTLEASDLVALFGACGEHDDR